MRQVSTLAAIGALAAAACVSDRPLAPTSGAPAVSALVSASDAPAYVVVSGGRMTDRLRQSLATLGAQVTSTLPELGLAFVTSTDPAFAEKAGRLAGIQGVAPDLEIQWTPPNADMQMVELDAAEVPSATPAAFGGLESFRAAQWAPDVIQGPAAWDLGNRGAGARVAILDGGIHSTHIDIASRLDVARSVSFVPNQPFNFDRRLNAQGQCLLTDTFWHGTHVAGIVAAPGQNIGTVGIAPDATIIGVKVLHCGSGSFQNIIRGIVYAATPIAEGGAGADIINMSLGAQFSRTDTTPPQPKDTVNAARRANFTAHLVAALGRATTYAYQRGVLVVASAGNDTTDLDHTANIINVPAQSPHVVSVSATAPLGWGLGATNFDQPTTYTNYGQSAISVAGPGGDFASTSTAICTKPFFPSGTFSIACRALDGIVAPCRGAGASISTYCWASGTSMSAPAVAGVAALIVGTYGKMSPAELRRRLQQSAEDLGKPGNDDFYGGGRVNALRAVQ
jgi:lantibiotic leader peptide-processing serine protease